MHKKQVQIISRRKLLRKYRHLSTIITCWFINKPHSHTSKLYLFNVRMATLNEYTHMYIHPIILPQSGYFSNHLSHMPKYHDDLRYML